MTQDHSGEEMDQTNTAEGNVSESAPSGQDPDVAPDTHDPDAHDAHDVHVSHDGDDAHGDHGDDASEQPTLVPVNWKQLIFPALILLLVIILLIGPVSSAFAPRPSPVPGPGSIPTPVPTATVAATPAGSAAQSVSAQKPAATPTVAPLAQTQPTQAAPPTAVAASGASGATTVSPEAIATRTAVAVLGQDGKVSRAPIQLQFEGAQFAVDAGSGVLPDWKPSGDPTHAFWIEGTYANHIIYLPYSDTNAALFSQVKTGDIVKLSMDSGQVFEFAVTRSQRVTNGPSTVNGQFTVTTAMSQDHAGVTIFLVGDPAADRAVVQADFTGNID